MAEFFWTWIWPALIIAGQSVLLLTALLIFTAFILYADRKIWAAVMQRRQADLQGAPGRHRFFSLLGIPSSLFGSPSRKFRSACQ